MGINNADTSRILVNPAVSPIFITTANLYLYLFCVSISLILTRFYNAAFSEKKKSLFNLLFQIRPENQSASLP